MARTESSMLPLGTNAPLFSLIDTVSDSIVNLNSSQKYSATVIMFICNHCPFVKHVNPEIVRLANDYQPKNVRFIAINSNDVNNYPDDAPDLMKKTAKELHYPFPYLFDETQEVARAFHATCTPDFFIFDDELSLVYRGQLDDSRPGNAIPLSGSSMRLALDQLIAHQPVFQDQKPSIGCNIKWK